MGLTHVPAGLTRERLPLGSNFNKCDLRPCTFPNSALMASDAIYSVLYCTH